MLAPRCPMLDVHCPMLMSAFLLRGHVCLCNILRELFRIESRCVHRAVLLTVLYLHKRIVYKEIITENDLNITDSLCTHCTVFIIRLWNGVDACQRRNVESWHVLAYLLLSFALSARSGYVCLYLTIFFLPKQITVIYMPYYVEWSCTCMQRA